MTGYLYEDKLESERLLTRFLTSDDILNWADHFRDKEAVELFPTFGLTTPEDRAKHWVHKNLSRYAENRLKKKEPNNPYPSTCLLSYNPQPQTTLYIKPITFSVVLPI